MRNYSEAVNMSICDLTKYVIEQSTNMIPSNPENFEDMKNLMNLFPVITNKYSSLIGLESYLKACEYKQITSGDKKGAEELRCKIKIVYNGVDALRTQLKVMKDISFLKYQLTEELKQS